MYREQPSVTRASRWLAFTLAVTAMAVLPFFLVATPAWDGWAHHVLYSRGDAAAILEHMLANGRPLGGWSIVAPMQLLGPTHGPKIVMALCLLASAGFVFAAMRATRLAGGAEAALVAVLTVCVPAVQTITAAAMPQYFIGMALLYAGLWAFVSARAGAGYLLGILLAVLAVLFGEAPLALLPLYPVLRVARLDGRLELATLAARWRSVVRHGAPVAAGALALGLQFHFFPAYGAHDGAHDLQTDAGKLLSLARDYARVFAVAMAAPLAIALLLSMRGWTRLRWGTVAIGIAAIALGALPYWISGREPNAWGWEIRTLLFTGFGFGLLALSLLGPAWSGSRAWPMVIAGVCLAASLNVAWRAGLFAARQATDDAVIAAVRAQPLMREAGLVVVSDPGWVVGAPYRDYEWTAIVQHATGRADVLALLRDDLGKLAARRSYFRQDLRMLRGEPRTGCRVDLYVPARPIAFAWDAIGSLWLRWTDQAAHARWLAASVPVVTGGTCAP